MSCKTTKYSIGHYITFHSLDVFHEYHILRFTILPTKQHTSSNSVLVKLLVWFLCTVHLNDSCLVLAIYLRWICIYYYCSIVLTCCSCSIMCPLQAALMILLTAQRQAAAGEMSLLAQPEVVQVLQSLVCSDNTASAAASPAAGKFCRSQYLEKVPSSLLQTLL